MSIFKKSAALLLAILMLTALFPASIVTAGADEDTLTHSVEVNIAELEPGKSYTPGTIVSLPEGVNYRLATCMWDGPDSTSAVEMVDGETHTLRIILSVSDVRNAFAEDVEIDVNGAKSYTIDSKSASSVMLLVEVCTRGTNPTMIGNVIISVTPPKIGTKSNDQEPQVRLINDNCTITNLLWLEGPNMYTSEEPELTFEEDKTYYIYAMIKADYGYIFEKSGELATGIDEGFDLYKDCTAEGGEVVFAASRTFDSESFKGDYLRVKIAVTPVENLTLIDEVKLVFTPPTAGTQVDAAQLPSGWPNQDPAPDVAIPDANDRYSCSVCYWYEPSESGPGYIESPFTFEEGKEYQVAVELRPAEGYTFNKDSFTLTVEHGQTTSNVIYDDPISDTLLCVTFKFTVYEAVTTDSETSYFAVWMCDDENNANTGGKVKIEYLCGDGTVPADSGKIYDSSTNQMVPGGTMVTLTAIPDEGYRLKGWYQANIDKAKPEDPHYLEEKLIYGADVYTFTGNPVGEGESPYICAVFEKDDGRRGDQIQVWATDGGKVAVKYEPSEPNPYNIEAKDGTSFVEKGEIVPFYKGDEITVTAKADDGYKFKGWYHVNIEWGPGEGEKYQGDVISTEETFSYKPGETVIPGDEEPLRYICAVFEKDDGTNDDSNNDTDEGILGDVNGDGKVTMEDVVLLQKYIAKLVEFTPEQLKLADVDRSGEITMLDVTTMQKFIAKLIDKF